MSYSVDEYLKATYSQEEIFDEAAYRPKKLVVVSSFKVLIVHFKHTYPPFVIRIAAS